MLKGRLEDLSLPAVLRVMSSKCSTGRLDVAGPDEGGRVFFAQGRIYAATSATPSEPLGHRLLRARLVTEDNLREALKGQQSTGERVGSILLSRSAVTPEALAQVVTQQMSDAVVELLSRKTGSFAWQSGEKVEVGVPVPVSTNLLLAAAQERAARLESAGGHIPSLGAVPAPVGPPPVGRTQPKLSYEDWAVLVTVDGVRSVEEVVADCGLDEPIALEILDTLVMRSLVGFGARSGQASFSRAGRAEDAAPRPVVRLDAAPQPGGSASAPRSRAADASAPAARSGEPGAAPVLVRPAPRLREVPDETASTEDQKAGVSPEQSFEIVFICTANRFRSPVAEAFMRAATSGLPVTIHSLGVHSLGIAPALPQAISIAKDMGIDMSPHRSRGLDRDVLRRADLVIGFERSHVLAAIVKGGAPRELAFTVNEFVDVLRRVSPPASSDPIRRARAVVEQADGLRGTVPWAVIRSDVVDPVGGPMGAYRNAAERLRDVTQRMKEALFG